MSRDRHWSDEEFVAHLYGVGPADDHPDACDDCRNRRERVLERRGQLLTGSPEISADYLAAQRRSILSRLESKPRLSFFRLVPSLAAVLLLLIGLLLFRPAPQPEKPKTASDSQLFEEVFSLASDTEPRAVEPVRHLFEVKP